jgi:maltooligosyltrehalose trehalohydrolase
MDFDETHGGDAPLGATVLADGGVLFRVWAPDAARVDLVLAQGERAMEPGAGGVWTARVDGVGAGTRYRFRVDGRGPFPDPYARSQPDGPHGDSEVVDPRAHVWRDDGWRGLRMPGLVLYELHVGTFTAAGTFDAVIPRLDGLRDLGVTAIELMPVAEWPGARNWGYDAVDMFAPSHVYGGPAGLRRLVDAAHARGMGVVLDVVYNHLGPDGNYLSQYARDYFTERYTTPWGWALNYDGANSAMVRRFVTDNVAMWAREYHIDGFRLDATFAIFDASPRHILAEIAEAARAAAAPRDVVLIAETHENDARYLRPASDGGFGFDAIWADDFHHAVHVRATGERQDYYAAYRGSLDEIAATVERGWLFDGKHTGPNGHTRGGPSHGVPATAFVYCLQNHDQVGNRAFGERLSSLIAPDAYRAWSALLLFLPYTPLLFMGQEFAARSPFLYFTDHNAELGRAVTEGRRREFEHVASGHEVPDPQALGTFLDAKLRWAERERDHGRETLALYGELLRLRREDPVLREQTRDGLRAWAAGDVLFVERANAAGRRLLVLNTGDWLGADASRLDLRDHVRDALWRVLLSTDEQGFGGMGSQAALSRGEVRLPHMAAVLFASDAPTEQ